MWILKIGATDNVARNLETLWAEYQAELRADRLEHIAQGVTVFYDGKENALKPLAPYRPSEDREGITVKIKGLDPVAFDSYVAAARFYDDEKGDTPEATAEKKKSLREAQRAFVEACFEDVGPLKYADGETVPFSGQAVQDFHLLDLLSVLGSWVATIPSSKKKLCGLQAPSTLPTSSSIAEGVQRSINAA